MKKESNLLEDKIASALRVISTQQITLPTYLMARDNWWNEGNVPVKWQLP